MESFQLLPSYNGALLRRLAIRFVPSALFIVVGVPYIIVHNSSTAISLPTLMIATLAVMAFMCYSVFRQYQLSCAAMRGYNLTLRDEGITVRTPTREIAIEREDVRQIVEAPAWGIDVKSDGKSAFIPAHIEGYDRVRAEVVGWGQYKEAPNTARYMLLMVAMMACMVAAFTAGNPIVAGTTSAVCLGIIVMGYLSLRRERSRPGLAGKAIFPMALLAAVMLFRIVQAIIQLAG